MLLAHPIEPRAASAAVPVPAYVAPRSLLHSLVATPESIDAWLLVLDPSLARFSFARHPGKDATDGHGSAPLSSVHSQSPTRRLFLRAAAAAELRARGRAVAVQHGQATASVHGGLALVGVELRPFVARVCICTWERSVGSDETPFAPGLRPGNKRKLGAARAQTPSHARTP